MIQLAKFLKFFALFPQNFSFSVEDEVTLNIFNEKGQYVGYVNFPSLSFIQVEGTIKVQRGDKILSIEFKG